LLTAAAVCSYLIYTLANTDEVDAFEETFSEFANQVHDTVQVNAQHKLEALSALALQIQAFAITLNLTWPNVTVPFFEEHVMATKSLTDANGVQLFPYVTNETRPGWEAYSVANQGWIYESYATQRRVYGEDLSQLPDNYTADPNFDWWQHLWGDDFLNKTNPDFSSGIADQIFGTVHEDPEAFSPIVDETDGPYFPQWQTAPMSWYYQTTVNSNYGNFPDFLNQTVIIRETRTAAFGMVWSDNSAPGYMSTLLYPIFDQFGNETSPVVAFISMDIWWEDYLTGILPATAHGIYVVINNTCGDEFSFKLHGGKAEFLDEGDLHEDGFEHLTLSFVFGQPLMEPITSPTYTGRPLYDDFCPYTFKVYPSKELESQYVTYRPIYLTIGACAIFVFTSFVFLAYDFFVERRQHKVLTSATRADAVVSSLFPKSVKERLYEAEKETRQQVPRVDNLVSQEPNDFMGVSNLGLTRPNQMEAEINPIAELYPETTILVSNIYMSYSTKMITYISSQFFSFQFSDLVGFTGTYKLRHRIQLCLLPPV
jgi:hypothetical protein